MENFNIIILALLVFAVPFFRQLYFYPISSKEKIEISQRMPFFDFIKGMAILAVIFIHVAYFYRYFPFAANDELFVNLMNNLARFAIPLFFICSGLLLIPLEDKKQYKNFYKRKIWRIFLPYFIVTLMIALYSKHSFYEFLYNLISGQGLIPYYFIIILLQLYLLYPILVKFRNEKNFLVVVFLISFICQLVPDTYYLYGIPLFFKFLFFFCYGIYCRERFLNYQPQKNEAYFWLVIIAAYIFMIFLSPDLYYNVRFFYGLAIFNLLFYFKDFICKFKIFCKLIESFGKNSLWIYLLHFQIMTVVYFSLSGIRINYYLNYFAIFLLTLLLSFVFSWLAKAAYDFIIIKIFNLSINKFYARSS